MRRPLIHVDFALVVAMSVACNAATSALNDPNSFEGRQRLDISLQNNQSIIKIVTDIENLKNDLQATNKKLSSAKVNIKALEKKIEKLERFRSYILTAALILGPLLVFFGIVAKFCGFNSLDSIIGPRIDVRIDKILPNRLKAMLKKTRENNANADNIHTETHEAK